MKKLITLISLTFIVCLCSFFTACGLVKNNENVTGNENEQILQIYDTYVVHAKENGETPLSYEDWLLSIKGEKGDKGDKGDQGIQGEKGDKGDQGIQGETGRGIHSVNVINGELYITYTDNLNNPVKVGTVSAGLEQQGTFGLEYYPLPDGTYAVSCGTTKYLKEITIPSTFNGANVSTIIDQGFQGCENLTKIEMPNSVTSIGDMAFYGCTSLTKVNYLGTIDQWAQIEFNNYDSNPLYYAKNLYINNELVTEAVLTTATKINAYAFYNCDSLTSIEIPNSVTSIGDMVFYGCDSLTSIEIPNSVTSIGSSAFSYCYKLTKINYLGTIDQWTQIEFGNSYSNPLYYAKNLYINNELVTEANITTATKISNYAFYNCTSLTSVVIGNSVTSIGSNAFYNCPIETATIPTLAISSIPKTKLKTVVINGGESIGGWAFQEYNSLTSVTIGNSVTSIGYQAFSGCTSLTSIEIPNSVTSIGDMVFYGCDSLTSIEIPNSVTSIGEQAFRYCYKLTSVVIGNSVTSIGYRAFFDCDSLTSVYYNGTKEDWAKINIDSYNANLTYATRYYYIENESDLPNDNGNYWHYVNGVPTKW